MSDRASSKHTAPPLPTVSLDEIQTSSASPAFATTDQRPVTHRFEHHRHRGPAADRLGDDLGFLRRLCLTGDWPAAEAFIAPTVNHPRVNHRRMLGALRRQAFLETVDAADTSAMSFRDDGDVSLEGGDVADRLVKALSALEPYVEDPKQFNDLCFLCTLSLFLLEFCILQECHTTSIHLRLQHITLPVGLPVHYEPRVHSILHLLARNKFHSELRHLHRPDRRFCEVLPAS